MEEFEVILCEHAKRYPLMEVQDCIKLLYQNEFGPGHAIHNTGESLIRLIQEMEETEADENAELYVPIGNGFCRFQLAKAKLLYTPEEINDWFVSSANNSRGSMASYMHKLKVFKKNWQDYGFPFKEEEVGEYLAKYRSYAYPPVHHSEQFHNTYAPHYRVMYMNRWHLHNAVNEFKQG